MDVGEVNENSSKSGLKGEEEDAGWDDVNKQHMLDELALEREEMLKVDLEANRKHSLRVKENAEEKEEEGWEMDKMKEMFEGMEVFGTSGKAETGPPRAKKVEGDMDTVYVPVVEEEKHHEMAEGWPNYGQVGFPRSLFPYQTSGKTSELSQPKKQVNEQEDMDSDDEFEMIEKHVPVDEKAQVSNNLLGKLPKIDTILSLQNQEQLTGRLQGGYKVLSKLPSLLSTGLQTFKTPPEPQPSYIRTIPLTMQSKSKSSVIATKIFAILDELIQPDSELRVTEAVHIVEKLYKDYCAEKVRAGRDPGDAMVGIGFLKEFWDVAYDVAAQLGRMDSTDGDGDGDEVEDREVARVFGTFMRKVKKVLPE